MKITSINPWLVKAEGTSWGEYFFIEVETDEGVTGWGEITTTTTEQTSLSGFGRELKFQKRGSGKAPPDVGQVLTLA